MPGIGVLVNMITVAIGGTVGTIAGDRFPMRVREGVVQAVGLVTIVIGLATALGAFGELLDHGGFLSRYGVIVFAGSMIVGTLIGELLHLEDRLERFGEFLGQQARRIPFFAQEQPAIEAGEGRSTMIEGFMTASLLFCVGAMTILGSIQDGLGDPQLLFLKALLDGFMAMFLASSLGAGVLLSIVPILIIQGFIALFGFFAGQLIPEIALVGIELTGGALITAVGLNFLISKRLPLGNMLPAILIACAVCWICG
jgi:uncharacterized membrane protein YqgA involved in biofilm formation